MPTSPWAAAKQYFLLTNGLLQRCNESVFEQWAQDKMSWHKRRQGLERRCHICFPLWHTWTSRLPSILKTFRWVQAQLTSAVHNCCH